MRYLAKSAVRLALGRLKRTLKARLNEHKQAVKRGDPKNGIAVHAHESQHRIDWDGTMVKRTVTNYWQRRATEAMPISSYLVHQQTAKRALSGIA